MKIIPLAFAIAAVSLAVAPVFSQESGTKAFQELSEAQDGMMKDMQAMKPSHDPDADFVMMMIPHHQAAIEMAKVQLKYGKEMELKEMAQKDHRRPGEGNRRDETVAGDARQVTQDIGAHTCTKCPR